MSDRLVRLAPLCGVVFAALVIAAIFTSGSTPEGNASVAKVLTYYAAHRSGIEASSILIAFAFVFLVLFAGSLRAHLRRSAAAEGAATVSLVGAVVMAVGALTVAAIEHGLAEHLRDLTPAGAQTASFLSNELFVVVIAGGFLFALPGGIAILRAASLPRWLGWVGMVLGIFFLIPFLIFPALIGTLAWTVALSVIVYRCGGSALPSAPESPGSPTAAGV